MVDKHSASEASDNRLSVAFLNNLAKTGWLSEQPVEFQVRMASLGRWVVVSPGQRLYSAGDPADAMIGLDQGAYDVLAPISQDEECAFYRARTGFWMGDNVVNANRPRELSAEAVTTCRILKLPIASLRRHLAEYPADWEYFYLLAAKRGRMTVQLVCELLALPPKVRIARLLLRSAGDDGVIESTHEDLGRLAGMSRTTFRRSLAKLVSSGALETEYGRLRITDRPAVERQAEEAEDFLDYRTRLVRKEL